MQKKYAKDGLVAMSVSLDDPADKAKVVQRLQKLQAGSLDANFILDEKPEAWQKSFEIEGPPCVFVFTRDGKYYKYNAGEKYDQIEKVVAQLLKK